MRIWEFFHWRASVVFALTGLALGCVLAAPFLAHSWLRQRAWVKAALYVPIFIAVVSLVRHATGTDEKLFFNFSPWPAIPVLGLELGAYTVIGALFGGGIALGALGLRGRAPILWALGFAVGLAVPAIWFASRFGAEATPPLIALTLVTGIGVAGTFAAQRGDPRASASLALAILLGAALAFAPLATGRALATGDYVVNKFVRSQILIDALARYYAETDDGYPDELETLIDAGYLETIPKPRLGFELFYQLGWLDRFEFFYRSLGSSYVLEFTSTEWVQCAYNPPWDDEEGEDDEEEDDESDEAWSCPDTRPELW